MTHYIAIMIPSAEGEWRVVFPDLPHCQAKASSFDEATFAARSALLRCVKDVSPPLTGPRDLSEVERDKQWLVQNDVDLSKAVITVVPLAA